jgi:hypothetical protein
MGVFAMLSGASEVQSGQISTDPLSMWLACGLHLDLEGLPVNPSNGGSHEDAAEIHMAVSFKCHSTCLAVQVRYYIMFKCLL